MNNILKNSNKFQKFTKNLKKHLLFNYVWVSPDNYPTKYVKYTKLNFNTVNNFSSFLSKPDFLFFQENASES